MQTGKRAIGFVINSFEYGGAQRVFIDDANQLAAAGYAPTIFVLYGHEGEYPLANEVQVPVVYLRARGPYDLGAVHRCSAEVRERGMQALMSTLNDGNIFARWVALRTGTRLFQREANTLGSKTIAQKSLDFVFGWVPYRYLAVSGEVRDSLARLVFYARRRIVLLPNAVAVPAEGAVASNPVPEIVAVGRLSDQKDYESLVRALGIVKREGAAFHATFIGEGYLREQIEAALREEHLEADVTLTGHVPHARVREAYAHADLFVSSSRWEGSPNVLLEAMSYGLACVSTAVGGAVDIIRDGEDGLLVPPGRPDALAEALAKLLANAELRARLGHAARARIEETFSRETRFKRLQALLGAA